MILPLPAAALRHVEPHLPPPLVGEIERPRCAAIGEALHPAACCAAFECRLTDGDDRVDYLACVQVDQRPELATLLDRPACAGIGDFVRDWIDPGSVLHANVPLLWLE